MLRDTHIVTPLATSLTIRPIESHPKPHSGRIVGNPEITLKILPLQISLHFAAHFLFVAHN
jgi:hypothetical protein